MPKETFYNLKKQKRDKVVNALLEEFTYNNFDEASISAVVKKIGIAKGSLYQYFEDKKDIFFYLVAHCGEIKKQFIEDINREDFPDFWSYYRQLYDHGYNMLAQYPLENAFLHLLVENIKAPSLKGVADQMKRDAIAQMEIWIKPEVENGNFRNDISLKELSFYLYWVSSNIIDFLHHIHGVNIKEKAKNKSSVYNENSKAQFMSTVDSNILFLQKAMNA